MKRIFVILAGSILGLAISVVSPSAEEKGGDFARGAKYYADNCGRCHNPRAPVEHRPREWSIVMPHMRIVAGLPAQQARDIEEFLRRSSLPPRPRN